MNLGLLAREKNDGIRERERAFIIIGDSPKGGTLLISPFWGNCREKSANLPSAPMNVLSYGYVINNLLFLCRSSDSAALGQLRELALQEKKEAATRFHSLERNAAAESQQQMQDIR